MRVRPCIAPNAPRGPHVCLCDHVCRRNTTNIPIIPEPLSCTTSIPPPHHHACTALWPRAHACGSETACHNRNAHISSTHTAAIDDPHTARGDLPRPPCVTLRAPRAETMGQQAARPRPRVPPSHYRLRVTRMQICAPPRTPSASHWWQMHPACAPLDDPSAPASRSRLRARAQRHRRENTAPAPHGGAGQPGPP